MAQKDVINTGLRVFCVVLAVAAIGQSSCIDDKRAILNNTEGPPLVGGWMKVENPQDDYIVKGIATSGLKAHNQRSNDMHQFGLFNDGDLEAYQQVVNGMNYCVQFSIVSNGCKNSLNSDSCRDGKKLICSVSAYQAFENPDATIDRYTLVCEKVVA